MVEKIMITPEKVRGYGNIMSPKTGADFTVSDCTLIVDTDTVNGELVTVYDLQPSTTVLSVSLTVDDNSVMIGESVTLSATVEDEMSDPVSGASVSFKLGGSSIGTSTTNSSGIATYTYTCNTAGTLTFSASCMGNNSNNVNVTVTGHNYSLTLDSTDYTVIGGNVVIKASLTDNQSTVTGASVSLNGGGSSWSATTDSNGVATFNLNNITTGGTYTASYSGVTATANVTISTVIWEDDFNRSTLGSNWIPFGASCTTTVSNENLALYKSSGSNGGIYYNQQVTGDYKVTIEYVSGSYDDYAIGMKRNTNNNGFLLYELQPKYAYQYDNFLDTGSISSNQYSTRVNNSYSSATTIVFEVTKDTEVKVYIDGTLKNTYAIQGTTTDGYVGIFQCCGRTTTINSIKVEPLQ